MSRPGGASLRASRSAFFALAAIVALLDGGAASAQTCVDDHCDFLAARLMIAGENCATSTFDHSQTVEYSQLVSGARDFGGASALLYPVHVFDERLLGTFDADDPGFTAVPVPCNVIPTLSPLPPNTDLFIDFLTHEPTAGGAGRTILYWDGVDDDSNGLDENDVDWSPVPIDEIVRVDELGTIVTVDGGTSPVPGLVVAPTSAVSNIHDHVSFELRRSGGGLATVGVYLLRMEMTMPGFAEGAPVFVVFATPGTAVDSEFFARTQVENELVQPLCNDGIDNDRDGFTDFAGGDPGCDDANDASEKAAHLACDDGIDNDLDGDIDFRAVDFGVGDLYATRDTECASPTDLSGEIAGGPAVPSSSGPGLVLLAGLLSLLALLHQLRVNARRA